MTIVNTVLCGGKLVGVLIARKKLCSYAWYYMLTRPTYPGDHFATHTNTLSCFPPETDIMLGIVYISNKIENE